MTNVRTAAASNLQAFREEIRTFLAAALSPELRAAGRRCAGMYCDRPIAQAWLGRLNDRGWAVPHWPIEYGGTGWSPEQHFVFHQEMALGGAPPITPNATRMVGPVVIAFGTPEQKASLLPRIRTGEDWWAQGFSEPNAGSDLAALKTSAAREGDVYVLNGSKIWTSHAQFSNKMFALVRTGEGERPQQGISFLLFDLTLPGVSVTPIISLSGDHEVNQVFLQDVRVPVSALLGKEGEGWSIAKYLLTHERASPFGPSIRLRLERLKARHAALGPDCEPGLTSTLATVETELMALETFELRELSPANRQDQTGVSSSMIKVIGSELRQRLGELEVAVSGAAHGPESEDAALALAGYFNDRAASIYAGANEVQRNIIARALLQ